GQVFVSRDGAARLLVGALQNDGGQSPAAYQDYKRRTKPGRLSRLYRARVLRWVSDRLSPPCGQLVRALRRRRRENLLREGHVQLRRAPHQQFCDALSDRPAGYVRPRRGGNGEIVSARAGVR